MLPQILEYIRGILWPPIDNHCDSTHSKDLWQLYPEMQFFTELSNGCGE